MENTQDWKRLLVIKVAPAPLRLAETEVDQDALGFLTTEKMVQAFADESVEIAALEKIWTEESRAAAAASRAAATKAKNSAEHEDGKHYIVGGRQVGQQEFSSFLNSKVGIAEAKASVYEKKASAMKGKDQRQFLHISNSYKATAGKIAAARDSWNPKKP